MVIKFLPYKNDQQKQLEEFVWTSQTLKQLSDHTHRICANQFHHNHHHRCRYRRRRQLQHCNHLIKSLLVVMFG